MTRPPPPCRRPVRILLGAALLFIMLLSAGPPAGSVNRTLNVELRRADGLMAAGKTEEALLIYSSLRKQHPKRPDLIFRLEAALAKLGRHQEAGALMVDYLKRIPGDMTARFRLGDNLYRLGDRDEAFGNWNQILRGASQEGPYALVAERYKRHNLQKEAEAIYRRGRRELEANGLFARELAELAEADGRFDDAVSEYVTYLDKKPQHLTLIESRVKQFAGLVDDHGPVLRRLAEEARNRPDSQMRLRLLTGYGLVAGRPDSVLSVFRQMTEIPGPVRAILNRVGSESLRAGLYAPARDAFELLVAQDQGGSNALECLLGLAGANRGLGLNGEAGRLYARVLEEAGNSPRADEAVFRLGELQLAAQDDETALANFTGLVESRRRSAWRDRALLEIGEIMLRRGEMALAVQACRALRKGARDKDAADEALLRIAEYQFLDGNTGASRKALDSALAGSTKRFVLNDVLELSLLVDLGEEDGDSVLESFAGARKLMRQGKRNAAARAFKRFLSDHAGSRLADHAAADRIRLLVDTNRYLDAVQACRRLLASPGTSMFLPWAQLTLGEIYESHLSQFYDARLAYQAVLTRFSDSLEADAARERLRSLAPRIEAIEAARKEAG